MKAVETAGDPITHDLIQLLNTQYVTPFDREDIYEPRDRDRRRRRQHRGGERPARPLRRRAADPAGASSSAASSSAPSSTSRSALGGLKGFAACRDELIALKNLEDEGDRIVRDAIAALFHDSRIDPLIVIRWKDIYEALEDAIDACETAANVLGNMVVKNA